MRQTIVAVLGAAALAGCLGDPVGPSGLFVVRAPGTDTLMFGAPGRLLSSPVRLRAVDGSGRGVPGVHVQWAVVGANARVDSASAITDGEGYARARWLLGTRAVEHQGLTADFRASRRTASMTLGAVAVPSEVARVRFLTDTTDAKLGVATPVPVEVADQFGNTFVPGDLTFASLDTAFRVDSTGHVFANRRGLGRVIARAAGFADTGWVHGIQVVARIDVPSDTVRFDALGQTLQFPVRLYDDQGLFVPDSAPVVMGASHVVDDSLFGTDLLLQSTAPGSAQVTLSVGTVSRILTVEVSQVPTRIIASLTTTGAIVVLAMNGAIPITCEARDRNGYVVPNAPTVEASSGGRWTGTQCDSVRAVRSGFDTLQIVAGSVRATIPIVLAVRPQLGSVLSLQVDSLPSNVSPTAPSVRRNDRGEIELYFSGGQTVPDSLGLLRSNLYRLVSRDGLNFRFDGAVLSHSDDPCAVDGSGIENIAIVPRADAPGWRMFYAGGSNACYGWQVFSAVSTDERTWIKEPGVRLSNGGTLPPDEPVTPPWPAGEGMVTDQLPDGTWRMIVSTYEHVTPSENKFQILEWRSPDQMTWAPVRTLVSTRDLPPEGQRSAYSPTTRQFAPGLWRMVFTADDLNVGGRSRLWSAVSTDLVTWQIEGEILGAPGVNYIYAALVDDHLYTLQALGDVSNSAPQLVTLTVTMP